MALYNKNTVKFEGCNISDCGVDVYRGFQASAIHSRSMLHARTGM